MSEEPARFQVYGGVVRGPWLDDEAIGWDLVDWAVTGWTRGPTSSSMALRVRGVGADAVDLGRLVGPRADHLVAALGRTGTIDDPVDALGWVGTVREGSTGLFTRSVFLEWIDLRWWHWQAMVGGDGRILDATVAVRRAVDGDALPLGLGRWWSRARREGLRGQLTAKPSETVH
jgi:hypothetical protein